MRSQVLWYAALAAGILAPTGFNSLARAATDVGQPAPALVVPELDGQAFDLSALRGKVVIVNFWATWCPPCREEMPTLDAFYRRYHGQGLEMIGVSADRSHDRSDVTKVMQSIGYPAAMLDDAKVNDFGTPNVLPMTVVVDRNGVVRAKLIPDRTPVTEKSLSAAVLPLLPQQSAAHASLKKSNSTPNAKP
jgi:cytochrome c biogenesis protein CcmG/thiol:disulfide interchange protein DsbE